MKTKRVSVYWTVSHSDVEAHSQYENLPLREILSDLGIDLSRGYTDDKRHLKGPDSGIEEVDNNYGYYHRSPFTGLISDGPRYFGYARQDGPWKVFVDRHLELPLI